MLADEKYAGLSHFEQRTIAVLLLASYGTES